MTISKERVAAALEKSIKHWEKNAVLKDFSEATLGTKDCALCGLFFLNKGTCWGCPVAARTGKPRCVGSPYPDAWLARLYDDRAMFRRSARAEVAFLKSLRVSKADPSKRKPRGKP